MEVNIFCGIRRKWETLYHYENKSWVSRYWLHPVHGSAPS